MTVLDKGAVSADQWMWCIMGYVVSVLQPRAVNVDLQTDATLQVDISDALSERDKVKFTVHTKVRQRVCSCLCEDMLDCEDISAP